MNLNVEEWKEFVVGKILDCNTTILSIKDGLDDGKIPFISRTAENNGCDGYVSVEPSAITQGNCLTVGAEGIYSFYQPKDFATGNKVYTLRNNNINFYHYIFISTILNKEDYKYSYGRARIKSKLEEEVIKLPIQYNNDNTPVIDKNRTYSDEGYIPDWQFMEDYIKSLHLKPIITKVKAGNVAELDVDKWEEFKISGLFTLLNGKGITKEEIEENKGTFVAVQSGEENNGVLGKIDRQYCIKMGYTLTDKMCLTVARTGSAGFVSFQSAGCVVCASAKILLLDDNIASINIYLFLQTLLTANRFKYDYGRKVTEDKYLADIIKLPIKRDDNGNPVIDNNHTYSDKGYIPDWKFMEDYINSLPYSDRI